MPRVSVIIPAYNPGPYLELAIQSVMAQTFTDWELIVVDDGSPEDLSYIPEKYPFVVLLRQQNQGQSAARNTGIANATGEFIAFLDQDDVWLLTKLENQVAAMDADPQIGLCHTQFDIINSHGEKIGDGFGRLQSYAEMLSGSGICGATTVMVRRSCLSPIAFETRYEPAEDYDLWLRLARDYKTSFIPSCQALYRQHESNQSRRYRDSYRAMNSILNDHCTMARLQSDYANAQAAKRGMKRIKSTYGSQAYDNARISLRHRELKPFVSHLIFAAMHSSKYVASSLLSYKGRK